MPNDPTLYPDIPNPQQQTLQRLVALEARLQAVERRRDLVVTPFNLSSGSVGGTYYGGRLWIIVGGSVSWTTPPSAGNKPIGADLKLNSTVFRSIGASGYAAAPNDIINFSLPLTTVQLTPAVLAATYALQPGDSWSLSYTPTGVTGTPAPSVSVSGLVIEWPQA